MLHWLEARWGHQDQDNTRALDIKSDLSSWINGLGDCDQTTEDSCTVMLYIPAFLLILKILDQSQVTQRVRDAKQD